MGEQETNLDNKVKSVFLKAIEKIKGNEALTLSDIYVQVGFDDLSLSVFDDDESLLAQSNIDEWDSLKEDFDTFEQNVVDKLKKVLHDKEVSESIESLDVIRPFSVVLVGDDFEQKEELYRLDDTLIVIEDDYLKKLDAELDDFLKNLLSDI